MKMKHWGALFFFLVAAWSATSCGSDGDADLDIAGTWHLNASLTSNTCGLPNNIVIADQQVTITQSGDSATVRIPQSDGSVNMLHFVLNGSAFSLTIPPEPDDSCPGGTQSGTGSGTASETRINFTVVLTIACPGAGACTANIAGELTRT